MTIKIKPEEKALWVDALDSGKHEQGTGHLCTGYNGHRQYCCLGVYALAKGASFTRDSDSDSHDFAVEMPTPKGWMCNLNDSELLDDQWAEQTAGLTHDHQNFLSRLNDGHAHTLAPDDPFFELAREYALSETPYETGESITFTFARHSFEEISAIIKKHF